jgi:predicted aconitase
MHLTAEEQSWLAGDAGPALQRAAEIIVALGKIYGAERLIPVESVQISGVSYRNLGPAGLAFLQQWAAEGARVRVPTTLNPAAMDLVNWRMQGFDPDFAEKQQAVIDAFARMGVGDGCPVPSCTPYLVGNVPSPGDHVAWAESSAVSYANSVLGARTNREGGPGALAAALLGRTGAYGLHLDANRRATLRVEVQAPPRTIADYSALGAVVGKAAGQHVPLFVGLPLTRGDPLWQEKLKALGAAMAATGAVALYHVADVTPEARADGVSPPKHETLTVNALTSGYAMLSDPGDAVDLVWIGCPHASLPEIARIAERVAGRRLAIPLWITCARPVLEAAAAQGHAATLEAAGARLIADACMAIAPVQALGFDAVATPSAKGAFYLRNLAGVAAHFGPLEQCLDAAIKGRWAA